MTVDAASVIRKVQQSAPPNMAGLAFPQHYPLFQALASQDSQIVFDSVRPMADEFWNLIDGQRSVGEIARRVCLEFGFAVEPSLLVVFARRLAELGLVEVV